MKQAIRCLACDQIRRRNKSYKVNVVEKTKVYFTGEIKEQEIQGRICRDCAESAGYKVRKAED